MSFESYYNFRAELLRTLEADVVGPESNDEIVSDPPITKYIAGVLYPQAARETDPAQNDGEPADSDPTEAPDPPVAMANVRCPSSMGLTFAVDERQASRLNVTIDAARYAPQSTDTGRQSHWKRQPIESAPVRIDVSWTRHEEWIDVSPGLQLFLRVRDPNANGIRSVTLVLVNRTPAPERGPRDAYAFFQPRITVKPDPEGEFAFVDRPASRGATDDPDLRAYELLYRDASAIAVGHGCSVTWDRSRKHPGCASCVSTTFVPTHTLHLAESNPDIDSSKLQMRWLANADRATVISALEALAEGYESWIGACRKEMASLPSRLVDTADSHLGRCTEAVERIRGGLTVLSRHDAAWRAFQLANRAMLGQRARTVWHRTGRSIEAPNYEGDHKWYPFQIAFVLICLEGLANPESEDRRLVDLLWFPTGGGKTEAYLGLIAFSLFFRRISYGRAGAGVCVIMRYTMRLLTIQQFERAALLICCAEDVRREETDLTGDPFSIGLWVGKAGTPNTRSDAKAALSRLRRSADVSLDEGNPIQIHTCPWCGSALGPRNYYIARHDPRLVIACRSESCEFGQGLPIYVIDEDVYERRPSLVIATSDKFAGLPWREECAEIFNLGDPALRTPELIIQDELHLISGPLGTLAGLYETAIDHLCSRDGRIPKVVASTATIRRAEGQSLGLFRRAVRQFPPPGLDARDSYFAVEATADRRPTRLYVGVMAPATSQTTVMVRSYASLLQSAGAADVADEVKDPYWTLVGYFNSLRVLGGARMQVLDDVAKRIELLANAAGQPPRQVDNLVELTSRESSADIPARLKQMEISTPDLEAIDVILATNMISVGVDIDRFGLMVVMGQPQSTSEYIQATSRVGRQWPGMVVTLLNSARSRDRSHYESFVHYHSALYRQVESTSVTPFSARARDRALHAVLIALIRFYVPELRPNKSARKISEFEDRIPPVKEAVLERVRAVAPDEERATARQIDEIVLHWKKRAEDVPELSYYIFGQPEHSLLVDAGGDDPDGWDAMPTLRSLRDVDLSSNLYLIR